MNYLLLVNAMLLSTIAAYYSIAGLVAIFSAAPVPIIVMGSILEVSKIVITSWVYRNWKITGRVLKYYFVTAVTILMLLTSMGIFGFLSKAHSDQSLVSGDVQAKLAVIDEKLKTERENVDANRKIISQLDLQVSETIARTSASDTSGRGVDRSVSIRRSQAKERQASQEAILSSQAKIAKLNEERAPIAAENRKVEAEVGPIKYVAALIYGDSPDSNSLERAVRWVIIMIVSVFDPLAVLMFVAYNQSMYHKRYTKSPDVSLMTHNDEPEEKPIVENFTRVTSQGDPVKEWERDRVLVPVEE